MRESASTSSKVVDFAAAARKRGRTAPPARPTTVQTMQITGNNNAGVIGNRNNVQINVRGPGRPKIQIMPGDNEVTNEQAAEIKRLVLKVAEVSATPHQRVYSAVYKRFETTSYQMIKRHRYDEVVKYLHGWIARYTSSSPSPSADADRKRFLARIHAQAKKLGGDMNEIRAYTSGRFATHSLAELTAGQLNEVVKHFHL